MKHTKFYVSLFSLMLFSLLFVSCSSSSAGQIREVETQPAPATKEVILATTTSTQDSGLLDLLIPIFQDKSGYIIKTIAVGTGQALEMGEQGNADVLLVHAPAAEKELMNAGYGSERHLVMHNDFIIVGPANDPAGISDLSSAAEAFAKIYQGQSSFISRGDDSGTHKKELEIWGKAGITPEGDWYQESGQGMGATLKIASEKIAYTLTDRATYLANQESVDLQILVEGDAALLNVYHVIVVNPERWPKVNVDGAREFANFLISPEGQEQIGKFGVDEFGQPLFVPDADKTDSDLGLD
jgi:tungstate transport system substrate-binding protein